MGISRREFIGTTAVLGAASGTLSADTAKLPTRVLGKTGARVSILAFGSGSRFLSYPNEDQAMAAIQKALDLGITYIDTADDYGQDRLSERRIGKAIQGRREALFIATKVTSRNGAETERGVERSLKALGVDRVDLLHIHALQHRGSGRDRGQGRRTGAGAQTPRPEDDPLHQSQQPCRTGGAQNRHRTPRFRLRADGAERGQVAMANGGRLGMVPNPEIKTSFQTEALPVALRKGMGVLAIKIYAQEHLLGKAAPEKLLYYTLSLPVTAAVIGMPRLEHIDDNVRMVKAFRPLPAAEMRRLAGNLSQKNRLVLDRFFRDHMDA